MKKCFSWSLLYYAPESKENNATMVFFLSLFVCKFDDKYWSETSTGLLFYAHIGINKVRILVFAIYDQWCPVPKNENDSIPWFVHHWPGFHLEHSFPTLTTSPAASKPMIGLHPWVFLDPSTFKQDVQKLALFSDIRKVWLQSCRQKFSYTGKIEWACFT